jgi:hypothetical protein
VSSRISELRDRYSRLSSVSPEGLFEADLESRLESGKSAFEEIFKEDQSRLWNLIKLAKKQRYIQLDKIKQWDYILANGLPPLSKDKLTNLHERVKYRLCHWFMAAYALNQILKVMVDTLRTAKEQYNIFYNSKTVNISNGKRRRDFLDFAKSYQSLTGSAIIIDELIGDYEFFLAYASFELGEAYPDIPITQYSAIRPSQLVKAAVELELHGDYSKHACPPLLRSAIEVALTRMVLDNTGTKHQRMIVMPTNELEIGGLAGAAEKLGLALPYSPTSIRALYEWGSNSIHLAPRMRTCEIWAAWEASNNISSINVPRVRPKRKEKETHRIERERIIRERESIIDRFVKQSKVRLIDRSTLDVMTRIAADNDKKSFISIKEETYKRFNRNMKKDETQDDALTRLLDVYEKNMGS